MNPLAPARDDATARAAELAELNARIDRARAELAALQKDLSAAHGVRSGRLVEANEQLVLAALQARADAESATEALHVVSRSAELDPLTELPNRVLLRDRLLQAIASARRHDERFALLFLDLDHFKQINDTLGHAAGDQVLRSVAQRLTACVREADTVSRLGGDEFVVLLPQLPHATDALLVAEKIAAAIDAPLWVGDHRLELTVSIGISRYPQDGVDVDTLLQHADSAMYRAKRSGHGSMVLESGSSADTRATPIGRAASLPASVPSAARSALPESHHADIRDANEQLVLTALGALESQLAAELAHRRQSDLLAIIAHELRHPMAPVRMAAAQIGLVPSSEPMLQRAQAVIERQVTHMARLVDDLLDVSRVQIGKLRLIREPVDLGAIVEHSAQTCQPSIEQRLQHFGLSLPAALLPIDGDPIRLTQVVCNLLDNASKYTPAGGHIDLMLEQVGDQAVLTVSDDGIGIAADVLPNVFDAFVQDGRAVGFNPSGLGIGLMVVRELVEAHGGSVIARSAGIGGGSRFVVTLPTRPAVEAPAGSGP